MFQRKKKVKRKKLIHKFVKNKQTKRIQKKLLLYKKNGILKNSYTEGENTNTTILNTQLT